MTGAGGNLTDVMQTLGGDGQSVHHFIHAACKLDLLCGDAGSLSSFLGSFLGSQSGFLDSSLFNLGSFLSNLGGFTFGQNVCLGIILGFLGLGQASL